MGPVAAIAIADPLPVLGLSICIPVLNEEGAIGVTLRRLLATREALKRIGVAAFEVIVVDDGSTDRTAEIAAGFEGVRLIRHAVNRGYGAALKTGFAAASHELVGFLDADATYPPERFPQLCEAVINEHADLVIGSRMAGADTEMPLIRRAGNLLFARLLTIMGRTLVTDSASGMRVFRREALKLLAPLPDGLNLTPVMSTRAVHEGIKIVEVPIPYKERVGASKLSPARDGMRFLGTMVWTVLSYNPVRLFGFAGIAGVALSAAIGAALVVLRVQGVSTLGPLGTFAVFVALVSAVTGASLFSLGASFNYLVTLFYRRPIRQGLFKKPLFNVPLEQHFWAIGLATMGVGVTIALTSLLLSTRGWPVERLWLYLSASALFILVGLQLAVSWIIMIVLGELSERRDIPSS
jgi:glycosyltransferase involved in cell wall biosynthesis